MNLESFQSHQVTKKLFFKIKHCFLSSKLYVKIYQFKYFSIIISQPQICQLLISLLKDCLILAVVLQYLLIYKASYNYMKTHHEDYEDCFIPTLIEEEIRQRSQSHTYIVKVNSLLQQNLPANELRTIRRPVDMLPRTLYKQLPFQTLPSILDQSGIELVPQFQSQKKKVTVNLQNRQGLSLKNFLEKSSFRCIYKKYQRDNENSKFYTGNCQYYAERMKCIENLSDYNWKLFKELSPRTQQQIRKGNFKIDSNFQCGNTYYAYIPTQNEKDVYIVLQNDVNTHGYSNWFFFRVKNSKQGAIRFHIVNMVKFTRLFKQGMRVSIFSMKNYQKQRIGWFKGGQGINLYQTGFQRPNHAGQFYYCLSFEFQCKYPDDQIYFAYNKPYTYTRLSKFLTSYKHPSMDIEVKNSVYTLINNILPIVKVSKGQNAQDRKAILLLARQHPSQTMGSFVIQGIMKHLMSGSMQSQYLLKNYQIFIIPMINPDGVIHGNSRTNFAGFDLNRQWGQHTIKQLTPQTFKVKQIVQEIHKNKQIVFMLDIHGHGKKLNSFMFACKPDTKIQQSNCQLFCYILNKIEPRFRLDQSTFGLTRDKQQTIRSLMFFKGLSHSYTLQNSFFGYSEKGINKHFNEEDFYSIGKSLIFAKNQQLSENLGYSKQHLLNEMGASYEKIQKYEKEKKIKDDSEIYSQSDPEGDVLNMQQRIKVFRNDSSILKRKMKEASKNTNKSTDKLKKNKKNSQNRVLTEPMKKDKYSIKLLSADLQIQEKNEVVVVINHDEVQKQEDMPKISTIRKKTIPQKKIKERAILAYAKAQVQKTPQEKFSIPYQLPKAQIQTKATKIGSSVIYQHPKQKKVSKKVHIRTESKQRTSSGWCFFGNDLQNSENKTIQNEKNQKFKNLKQQSLKVLLTDSLSVLKLDPPRKNDRNELKVQQRDYRAYSQVQSHSSKNKMSESVKPYSNGFYPQKQSSKKYQRFQKFLQQKKLRAKHFKNSNSVLYYFPVL